MPEPRSPQHRARPRFVNAQVWFAPLLTWVNSCPQGGLAWLE
ncbi:hypothetical protein OV208_12265 [Corallococcus sp. bb12-1]|nr:hypothetical protein [Corallococcus sp. bb12-1]MCY1042090.1 hypothetical protein [Corallococcus sp. bb12-1]